MPKPRLTKTQRFLLEAMRDGGRLTRYSIGQAYTLERRKFVMRVETGTVLSLLNRGLLSRKPYQITAAGRAALES